MTLACKGLLKVYDSGCDCPSIALNQVTYRFPETGLVGITGPSGSGKSTFLHCLSTLMPPTDGAVVYGGKEISRLPALEQCRLRQKSFGLIFQKDFLIPYLNCLANILVREDSYAQEQRAKELMEQVGLEAKRYARSYPAELSGGQRQRVAIARGLIGSPAVVFADEPTASLDKASVGLVMDLFKNVSQTALVLIVTHDMAVMGQCAVPMRFEAGELVV